MMSRALAYICSVIIRNLRQSLACRPRLIWLQLAFTQLDRDWLLWPAHYHWEPRCGEHGWSSSWKNQRRPQEHIRSRKDWRLCTGIAGILCVYLKKKLFTYFHIDVLTREWSSLHGRVVNLKNHPLLCTFKFQQVSVYSALPVTLPASILKDPTYIPAERKVLGENTQSFKVWDLTFQSSPAVALWSPS